MPDGDDLTAHDLFGGAIELRFPARLTDVSTVRDVPDHQEVGVPHHRIDHRHKPPPPSQPAMMHGVPLVSRTCAAQVFADGAADQSLIVEVVVRSSRMRAR